MLKTWACSGSNFVLNELHARLQHREVLYWRNKRGAEIDFVLPRRGRAGPIAIECKWKAASFQEGSLLAFRRLYPAGTNFVVAADVDRSFERAYRGTVVRFVSPAELVEHLTEQRVATS